MTRLAALVSVLLLAACWGEKPKFVAACTGDTYSEGECGCMYDLAGKELSPADKDLFVAAVIEGENAAGARLEQSGPLGAISSGLNMVRFLAKVEQVCRKG